MTDTRKAYLVLAMNTLAFAVCFACWMMNGVLVTFLVENGIYAWDKAQIGWLIGIPVLTGSLMRLPVGVLTDKYGGRPVYIAVMLFSAVAMFCTSYADSFLGFVLGGLGFGLAGASFAVGIAYTSIWFRKERQGTALGIFGAGNAGAAVTSLGAPLLLRTLTEQGQHLENWRTLPKIYALTLLFMTVLFFFFTTPKKIEHNQEHSLLERLAPLKEIRVWRFGLYYFFVFGGFVALAQWLIPYYVSAYSMSIVMAGLMASIFTLPSGVIRAFGGWLSDHCGARRVMYWVFGSCLVCCALLMVPRMDIYSPGSGVMAMAAGQVDAVDLKQVRIGTNTYELRPRPSIGLDFLDNQFTPFPKMESWQEPVVAVGEIVKKKQLLAKGMTHLYFQANVWIFTVLVFIVGIMMGIGKAAVYKYIPDYFPKDVGVVGGIVGVLGGLGGFFCPIMFGYLLKGTGIWTTCWAFFTVLVAISLFWMHKVVQKMMRQQVPDLMKRVEQ